MDGWLPYWTNGNGAGAGWNDVIANAGRLDSVSFFAYSADPETGALTPPEKGMDDAALVQEVGALHTRQTQALLTVTLFGNVHALLASRAAQSRLIRNLLKTTDRFGFDGVDIDFEDFKDRDEGDAALYTAFAGNLASQMHAVPDYEFFPKMVTVTLAARTKRGTFRFADEAALANTGVDRVRIMAYDDYYPGSGSAGACAPLPWDVDVARYVSGLQAPEWKFELGIPGYAYRWPIKSAADWTTTGKGESETFSVAQKLMADHQVTHTWDDASQTPRFQYVDGSSQWVAFYEDCASWKAKVDSALLPSNMAGLSEWAIGYEDPSVWPMLDREFETPYPIYGVIGDCYARMGGGARFGSPQTGVLPAGVRDASTLNDYRGLEQDFEHGRIYYHWGQPRAYAVTGKIMNSYMAAGGPAGNLGFPTSDPLFPNKGESIVHFEHGDLNGD